MGHITWFICLILQTSCHISDKMAANLILQSQWGLAEHSYCIAFGCRPHDLLVYRDLSWIMQDHVSRNNLSIFDGPVS